MLVKYGDEIVTHRWTGFAFDPRREFVYPIYFLYQREPACH